jgi:hypothetical protein
MTVAVFPFRPFTSRLILTIPSSGQPDGGLLGVADFFFLHLQAAAGFPHLRQMLPVSVEYTRRLLILNDSQEHLSRTGGLLGTRPLNYQFLISHPG